MTTFIDKVLGRRKEEDRELQAEQRSHDFARQGQLYEHAAATEEYDQRSQTERSDLLKWQQNLDDELVRLRHRLRSEVLDENNQWVPKMIPVGRDEEGRIVVDRLTPLANELFIDYIQTQIEPFLSRNLFSSNFTEKRILEMLKNTCNDYADNMADNWDIYGIDFINFNIIDRLIKNVIVPGPFRALNDGQRRHDRTIAKRIEAFNDKDISRPKKTLMGVNVE